MWYCTRDARTTGTEGYEALTAHVFVDPLSASAADCTEDDPVDHLMATARSQGSST